MKYGFLYTMRIKLDGHKYFRWGYSIDKARTEYEYNQTYRQYNLKPYWEDACKHNVLIRRKMTSYLKPNNYKSIQFMNQTWYPIQPRYIRRAMAKVRKNQF